MLSDNIWYIISIVLISLMLFGNKKVRVYNVFIEQIKVFKNAKKNKISLWDIFCFIIIPIILSTLIVFKFEMYINSTLAGILTTVFSLIFTILFGFAAILIGRIDSERKIEKQVVEETFISIVSCTLLALISTIISIIIATIQSHIAVAILSVILYSLSFSIILLLLLITKRTFIIYSDTAKK